MSKILNLKKSKKFVKTVKTVEPPKDIHRHDILFDLNHLKSLLDSPSFYRDVPLYINRFFFKYNNDIFYDNGETFVLLSRIDAKNKIPSNYSKKITTETEQPNGSILKKSKEMKLSCYFDMDLFLKTNETKLTIDYNKEYKFIESKYIRGFEVKYNYLNMKKDLPRNYDQEIKITDKVRLGVKMFFDHIKSIICSDDADEYDTTIKFIASSCAGHKLKIALIWNSEEQTGKGTVLNYLKDLLGSRMYKTSSIENVEKYNKGFEGCTLLNFDELPVSGTSKTLQDVMKAYITEPNFDCREMYSQSYSQLNTFNIIITSNNNSVSLTQSNHVRYYSNTISDKYSCNKNPEYFKKLHKAINDEQVKIAIFQEFMKIYEEQVQPINWLGNETKTTKTGIIKKIEALPLFVKYIKNKYLMAGRGINDASTEFIAEYQFTNKFDKISSTSMGKYLGKLNVILKKIDNKEFKGRKYIISYKNLKQSFIDNKWILDDELEELEKYDGEIDDEDEPKPKENPIDFGLKPKEILIEDIPVKVKSTKDLLEDELQEVEKYESSKPNLKINKSTKVKPIQYITEIEPLTEDTINEFMKNLEI